MLQATNVLSQYQNKKKMKQFLRCWIHCVVRSLKRLITNCIKHKFKKKITQLVGYKASLIEHPEIIELIALVNDLYPLLYCRRSLSVFT